MINIIVNTMRFKNINSILCNDTNDSFDNIKNIDSFDNY